MQILWVSLQKCSPQSVPRINFYPSGEFCNTLNINRLNLVFYILCGANKNSASESSIGFIIARCENRFELLKDLVRFFKEYMPRYGYKHLCTEDDDYKYYQTLNLPCIKRGFMGYHCNYGAPLKDVDV